MSAVPPAYNPPQRSSSNKVWLWILLAVVAFCILAMVGLFFAFKGLLNTGMGIASCGINAELAHHSLIAYAKEHNGKFPDAATWQDDIKPYYTRLYEKIEREMNLKDMPSFFKFEIAKPGQVLECPVGPDTKTGFAFNSLLAGQNVDDIKDKSTIVIWETEKPEYNANGDPAARGPAGSKYKIFGQERDYIDVPLEGNTDFMKSSNSDFNIDMSPEDALEPKPTEPQGTEPNAAENPEPRPKQDVK